MKTPVSLPLKLRALVKLAKIAARVREAIREPSTYAGVGLALEAGAQIAERDPATLEALAQIAGASPTLAHGAALIAAGVAVVLRERPAVP